MTNTLNDYLLEDVRVEMEESEGFSVVSYVPIPLLPYNHPKSTYTLVELTDPSMGKWVGGILINARLILFLTLTLLTYNCTCIYYIFEYLKLSCLILINAHVASLQYMRVYYHIWDLILIIARISSP